MKLPRAGTPLEPLLAAMRERKGADADWRHGRTWSLVYPAGEEVDEVLRRASNLYLFENALNPYRFPSLRAMEGEIVAMTLDLLNAPQGAGGAMTSGGTESIVMAVKAARNRARAERGVKRPEMIIPRSAHPAFAKAAELLCVEVRQAPLGQDFCADVAAVKQLVTDRTVLIVGSAPSYPHGVIDPIPELAEIALERGIAFHTDACIGGFLLPFLERLGHEVPPFDFRVPGVTSMSADVHKYGYCVKGASVVAHRDKATLRHQMFLYEDWPGGLYGSPAIAGARPAVPVAAAWAVMNYLGEEGYLRLAASLLETVAALRHGIESIPELRVWGEPIATVLAFGSDKVDIMAVGDAMDDRGWHLDRQREPEALHMMISPAHAAVVEEFLADLRHAVAHHGPDRGKEARYS